MTNEQWKINVQEPYVEAFSVLATIQHADENTDLYFKYQDRVGEYGEKYKNNPFGAMLFRFLRDADNAIGKLGGNSEVQKTKEEKPILG